MSALIHLKQTRHIIRRKRNDFLDERREEGNLTSIQMEPSRLSARSVQCLPNEAASALPYELYEL